MDGTTWVTPGGTVWVPVCDHRGRAHADTLITTLRGGVEVETQHYCADCGARVYRSWTDRRAPA
jgi:hypothetical protein